MTLLGCGPRLAFLSLPYVTLSLTVMYKDPEFLYFNFMDSPYIKVLGLIWLGLGLIFWIYSAIFFLKHFKPGQLITQGPFALCRNPIYSSIIVFIIPSLAIIYSSGLIFTIALVLYLGFKFSIHGETIVLRRTFDKEYEIYEKAVNEIIPFPRHLFREQSIKNQITAN